ncbi:MAG: tripartite tricarboxylate transporter TctB family protein [Synergistaceae bacterium]|nr:tripartite tricarboxylate transporter TctB family protein [Synergistaceae bacterium]
MKKTDIGVCAVFYAVCAFFMYEALHLPEEAQIYPMCIIAALFALTSLQVFNMVKAAKREGVTSGLEDFKEFVPSQFFALLYMIIAYLALMYCVGFYISSLIFVAATLLFLKVKLWQIIIVELALLLLVYFAFTMFLGVQLPEGVLFA